MELSHGWTTPNPVGLWPGKPLDWIVGLAVHEATEYAVRNAELSGRGMMTQPTTYYDFSLLPRGASGNAAPWRGRA